MSMCADAGRISFRVSFIISSSTMYSFEAFSSYCLPTDYVINFICRLLRSGTPPSSQPGRNLPMPVGLTLYDVLGIPTDATTEEVRKAYKTKALETHPDKLEPTASDRERRAAEGKFRNVCEAFQVLSDPTKRKAYDTRIQYAQLNKQAWDAEREKRNKEREEWARQAKERSDARMKARADLYENMRKIKEQKEVHTKLVEQFYQELRDRNPEWEIRKQEALKRKEMRDKEQLSARHSTR
ncbi:DnaJ domain-containing protein [Butyriboletus roseoflavus]|nr:DnaJ domain-containing protein [Butyriboletus roseoflavus]